MLDILPVVIEELAFLRRSLIEMWVFIIKRGGIKSNESSYLVLWFTGFIFLFTIGGLTGIFWVKLLSMCVYMIPILLLLNSIYCIINGNHFCYYRRISIDSQRTDTKITAVTLEKFENLFLVRKLRSLNPFFQTFRVREKFF